MCMSRRASSTREVLLRRESVALRATRRLRSSLRVSKASLCYEYSITLNGNRIRVSKAIEALLSKAKLC